MRAVLKFLGMSAMVVAGFMIVLFAYAQFDNWSSARAREAAAVQDRETLTRLLRKAAITAGMGDKAFVKAQQSMESFRSGKPLYLIVDEVSEQAQPIQYAYQGLANLAVEQSKELQDPTARERFKKGAEALYVVNKVRYGFLSESTAALNGGSVQGIKAASEKYGEDMQTVAETMLMAMAHFVEAKQALGMPPELDEFR